MFPIVEGADRVLTPPAVAFVEDLTRRFRPRIDELLERRRATQARFNAGARPDFLAETAAVRSGDWKVGAIPADLQDRRVEITGPVDRKMIINALNSGANVFMADFEDATSPTWANLVGGQANLMDAVRRTISLRVGRPASATRCKPPLATLMVRPRGFHLPEQHFVVDGRPAPGMLFDFGLYLFHNAAGARRRGHRPVLLPAEDAEPSRGAAVERDLPARAGGAEHPGRHDQGDGPHRDAARRVRDGRDPLRAPRSHRRAQLRPLGLHLQLDQDAAAPTRRSCCPIAAR